MNVSPNELRKETVQLLKQVNTEMQKFETEATLVGSSPFQIADQNGIALYSSLVVSKALVLNTLTLLNEQR